MSLTPTTAARDAAPAASVNMTRWRRRAATDGEIMGQKQKARAIAEEAFEFEMFTSLPIDGILAAAQRAAQGSRKMGVGVVEKEVHKTDDGALSAGYRLRGPGGLVEIMVIIISGKPEKAGRTLVSLKVGDFLFKKGSLGMKPTINGHKVAAKFVALLKAELAAG